MDEITNNEMTNVAEDVAENVVPEVAKKLSFKDKYPALYAGGAAALIGGGYIAGVCIANAIFKWGSNMIENFKENRAAKKAEKTKVVEASEVVVEEEA